MTASSVVFSSKDKEVSHGAHAPRILALDDYFLMEVEKSEKDPETGRKVKKKVRISGIPVNCLENFDPSELSRIIAYWYGRMAHTGMRFLQLTTSYA